MTEIKCVSPVTGEVYVTRQAMFKDEALDRIKRSKAAGKAWAARSLDERRELVMKAVHQLATHRDEAADQVANMMGRPKAQFFEFNGCIERATYMADIAEELDDKFQAIAESAVK